LKQSPLARVFLASAAIVAAFALAGCYTDGGVLPMSEKAARPLPEKLVKEIEEKNMDKEAPILVRTFKEEAELEVWKQDRTGRFALLKTYPICRWSGELGPKIREGDRQAPEGFYNINPGQMNPNSQYYLSFDLGYPNAFDRALGRTGAQLMVHGDCSSRGCYSMTDEQITEIYALGRDAFFGGQKSFQVQAYPFHMTAVNMAKHRDNPNIPFWRMLKKGSDHFDVTHLEPKVNVCDKQYVFDAEPVNGQGRLSFSPAGRCPAYKVPDDIAEAVREKQQDDDIKIAELTRRGVTTAPVRTGADGGMNPVFVAAVKRNQIGIGPVATLFSTTPPGTIPTTVRPPRIPELADAPIMRDMPPPPKPAGEPNKKLAIAEPEPAPEAKSNNLWGSSFSESTLGRWMGLGKSEPEQPAQAQTQAAPKARPKPSPAPTRVANHGAIKPKVADKNDKTADKTTGTADATPMPRPSKPDAFASSAPQPAPAPTRPAAPPPASTAMNGSAPLVPAGTFDSRWSGN
jgi:murein L,D-transpeptidase YafK